jgi:hypothetical protein
MKRTEGSEAKVLRGGNAVSVGYGKHFDVATAVAQSITGVEGEPIEMLMVFSGGKQDPRAVISALQGRFPGVPIIGGSAAGAIWRGGSGYSGLEVGTMAFHRREVVPHILVGYGMLGREREVGVLLGAQVVDVAEDGAVVMLLFDSVASSVPLQLHPASTIVSGVTEGLGSKAVRLFGGGLLTDMNLSDAWVFDGREVVKHAAVALVFPKTVSAEIAILHGCRPVSTFMEITRIDGADVYELDGQPALTVVERMLGLPLGGSKGQELTLVATLGEKQGDPFAPYDENTYVNRLILSANRAAGSITLFEPDFALGTRVQIMARDNALMLDSVRKGMAAMSQTIADRDNLIAFYIDCAGRASGRSGAPIEEADLVRQSLPPALPLLGFYSGVEVAPFQGYSRPLDWTGVIAVLQLAA